MSKVGAIERIAQNRVVKLFQDELKYRYLGNLEKEENNSNVDEALINKYKQNKPTHEKDKDFLMYDAENKYKLYLHSNFVEVTISERNMYRHGWKLSKTPTRIWL